MAVFLAGKNVKAKRGEQKLAKGPIGPNIKEEHITWAIADYQIAKTAAEKAGLKTSDHELIFGLMSHAGRQYAIPVHEAKKHKITERRFWLQLVNIISPWIVAAIMAAIALLKK